MIKNITIFQNPARLFFMLASVMAILVPMFTVTVIVNSYSIPPGLLPFYQWHGFQMVFCFFFTVYIGQIFAITIPSFTKKSFSVSKVLILFFLWINEQIAIHLYSTQLFVVLSSAIFSITIVVFTFNWLHKYKYQIVVTVWTLLFSFLKLYYLFHATSGSVFKYKDETLSLSIWMIIFLITLFSQSNQLANFKISYYKTDTKNYLSYLSLFSIMLIPSTIIVPSNHYGFFIYFISGVLNLISTNAWKLTGTIRNPFTSFFKISYAVIFSSLIIKGLSFYFPLLNSTKATLHMSLTGGASLFCLSIMIATMIKTYKSEYQLNKSIIFMYFCILVGFFIRVIIPIYDLNLFHKSLHYSMGMWTLAFLVYFLKYLPIVIKKGIN